MGVLEQGNVKVSICVTFTTALIRVFCIHTLSKRGTHISPCNQHRSSPDLPAAPITDTQAPWAQPQRTPPPVHCILQDLSGQPDALEGKFLGPSHTAWKRKTKDTIPYHTSPLPSVTSMEVQSWTLQNP